MSRESVWDYPRPPKVEPTTKRLRIEFAGELVADTQRGIRVLETSHPPVYYIPLADIRADLLSLGSRHTFCEFKGLASDWTLRVGDRVSADAAWSYERPLPGYEAIRGHLASYVVSLTGFDAALPAELDQARIAEGDLLTSAPRGARYCIRLAQRGRPLYAKSSDGRVAQLLLLGKDPSGTDLSTIIRLVPERAKALADA